MPRKGYPAPLVVQPSGEHTHTIIALHGRGSNSERFGLGLLASGDLKARLPTVKFVFPTASKRRSTILKKIPINQWYDNYSLEDPGERTDLQIDGLSETAEFIRGLIDGEARILNDQNYERIILMGISQGGAAAIFALLGGWTDATRGQRIGAFVGMSGWLPFEEELRHILRHDGSLASDPDDGEQSEVKISNQSDSEDSKDADHSDDDDVESEGDSVVDIAEVDVYSEAGSDGGDPFAQDARREDEFNPFEQDEEEDETPLPIQAINHIREILELPLLASDQQLSGDDQPSFELSHLRTPVFVGHGAEDPKVSSVLGNKMSTLLSVNLGMDVTWREYEGLGHWYRVEDEIEDVLMFLKQHVGLEVRPLAFVCKTENQEE